MIEPTSTFHPFNLIVGTVTTSSQLLSGLDVFLPDPTTSARVRPPSTLTFDISSRRIKFTAYCQGCEGVEAEGRAFGQSRRSMWPLEGDISWDSLVTRGIRLDQVRPRGDLAPVNPHPNLRAKEGKPEVFDVDGDDEDVGTKRKRETRRERIVIDDDDSDGNDSDISIEIVTPPPKASSSSPTRSSARSHCPRADPSRRAGPSSFETLADPPDPHQEDVYNLRISLRRPPHFNYTYPDEDIQVDAEGRWIEQLQYPRRATEEDYVSLEERPAGTKSSKMDPLSVVGRGGKESFFDPGHWLTYCFTMSLLASEHANLVSLLDLVQPSASSGADIPTSRLPPTMPLPTNPRSLLSSIVPYRFETRYLLEALVSYGVVATEDLTHLCALLRTAKPEAHAESEQESEEKKEAILVGLFGMGKVSGKLGEAFERESSPPRFVTKPSCVKGVLVIC